MSEKKPKQFRFQPLDKKDGITETMRVFTDEGKSEIASQTEKIDLKKEFSDEEINFDFLEEPQTTESKNLNPDKITDTMFDLRQVPSLTPAPAQEQKKIKQSQEPTKFELGPAEGDQNIEKVVQDAAKKRTVLYKEKLMDAIRRIKVEENKKR